MSFNLYNSNIQFHIIIKNSTFTFLINYNYILNTLGLSYNPQIFLYLLQRSPFRLRHYSPNKNQGNQDHTAKKNE